MFDILIKNARIADGSGQPSFVGNIAVQNGRIAHVFQCTDSMTGKHIIDADGCWTIPGFVDIHRHGDLLFNTEKPGEEELRTGVTSFVNGNCGFSPAPSSVENFDMLRQYAKPIIGCIPRSLCGSTFNQYLQTVQARPMYCNMGFLVGSGAVRIAVKGFDTSPMRVDELANAKELMREAFSAGALGMSMGLMYVPENFYITEELKELCTVAANAGRLVTVHMRGEGSSLLASIGEVLKLAKQSGGAFHISHLKAAGKKNWYSLVPRALEMILDAQQKGLDITFDVYPYTAGSTALYTLLPPSMLADGVMSMLEKLRNSEIRRELCEILTQEQTGWDNLIASTGWDNVMIAGGVDATIVGHTVADIADKRGTSPVECAIDLLLQNKGNVPIVFYSMSEEDVRQILMSPGAIVISDALYSDKGNPHPRRYGSQIRLLSRYGRSMGMERAVRSVTALPAERMGLLKRGFLKQGYYADILLLDIAKLRDTATYENPVQFPEGIRTAVVNGILAIGADGLIQGSLGHLLRS